MDGSVDRHGDPDRCGHVVGIESNGLVAPSLHVTIGLGDGQTMNPVQGTTAVISPDGTTLAFVGRKGGTEAPQLYVRRSDH
jgi:WD40-like Beta Propeller Repeat